MDFAKRILGKYGWKEGDGLGKHSDGIVKPLKASMKFDNAGLGADRAASDFNNHWWERVFNEAAQNVEMKTQENGTVGVDLKNADDSVEISTKGYSVKKLKRIKAKGGSERSDARYDNFLQSATLTQTGDEVENAQKIVVDDIEVAKYKVLTDEELFRACGGRTAHKGARHGLKLSGKLSRLERQEQELLAKMQQKLAQKEELTVQEQKPKKKKKHKIDEVAAAEETVSNSSNSQKQNTAEVLDDADAEPAIPKRKELSRLERQEQELLAKMQQKEELTVQEQKPKKKKKPKIDEVAAAGETVNNSSNSQKQNTAEVKDDADAEPAIPKRKELSRLERQEQELLAKMQQKEELTVQEQKPKKKKKHKLDEVAVAGETVGNSSNSQKQNTAEVQDNADAEPAIPKKKKKSKRKRDAEQIVPQTEELAPVENDTEAVPKKKKKKRKQSLEATEEVSPNVASK